MKVVTACIILARRAISLFFEVGNFWFRKAEIKIALQNLSEIGRLQRKRTMDSQIMGSYVYALVEMKNITYRDTESFSDNKILDNLSFKVNCREFYSIDCPDRNASRAITKIMSGRLKPSEDDIYIDGFKASEWDFQL